MLLKFYFEPMEFVNNLPYMAKGLAVIFVVIGAIVAATAIINKIFKSKG